MELNLRTLLAGLAAVAVFAPAAVAEDEPSPGPTPAPAEAPAPAAPEPAPAAPAPAEAPPAPEVAPAPEAPELPPGHPPIDKGGKGVKLPGDIRLHGRFDVAYERHSYTDDLTEGRDAFRNFHRFVFLERHVKDDPFFFNAEILGLSFFEIGAKLHGNRDDIWRLSMSAGKILVPFGADPLFHHAYGGRVGQDNRVLPIVWGEYGLKFRLDLDLAPVTLRLDAYAMRGYALRKATDVFSVTGNAAPLDDLNFAGGGRLSASFHAATLSYSFQGGTLDFDRSLFMQALDITLWRLDLPVLEDIAITAGVMRADVWGGDLKAFYNFADYIQLRYYPLDWLYIQYRGGFDTRDNRKGAFVDTSRLDMLDTSAHSLAVGYIRGNFSLVIQHLWQLELVDEQADDFFRVTATYEF